MNVLDLFSGIGAFALGMQRAGMHHAGFCEIDPFCRRVLAKHWPDIPCHTDIRKLDSFGRVNGICGGFPCQPFSTASRGRRVAENLWPDMQRVVDIVRPDWIVAENVQEEAIAHAAECLNGLGYPTYYRRISAADAGADHIRNRWWLVAHPDAQGELRRSIDAEVAKLPALCAGLWGAGNYARAVRILDGPPDRMDRIGSIGNAVIPQIPEAIGRAIMKTEREKVATAMVKKWIADCAPELNFSQIEQLKDRIMEILPPEPSSVSSKKQERTAP